MAKRKRAEAEEQQQQQRKTRRAVSADVDADDAVSAAGSALETSSQAGVAPAQAPIDTGKLASKLHHHIRVLRATAKRARTFETQRTVKKLKSAKDDEERAELERELGILKTVDTAAVAAKALLAKCAKSRLLPKHASADKEEDSEAFPLLAALRSEGSLLPQWSAALQDKTSVQPQDQVEAKVHARLASSKLLAEEVGGVVTELQHFIKPEAKTSASAKGKERAQDDEQLSSSAKAKSKADKTVAEGAEAAIKKKARKDQLAPSQPKVKANSTVGRSAEDQDEPEKSASAVDVDGAAGEVDFDSDGEEEDIGSDINSDIYDDEDGNSEADDDDDAPNLPALASGFVTRGLSFRDRGSDSEYSGGSDEEGDFDMDIDENAEESAVVGADGKKKSAGKDEKRKNRPGQRARQALWEKKYGRNARHIAILKREPRNKRPEDEPGRFRRGDKERGATARPNAPPPGGAAPLKRDQGWASARGQALAPQPRSSVVRVRRPPGGTSDGAFRSVPPQTRAAAGPKAGSGPSTTVGTKQPSEPAAPHPSWLAKQKQKEQLSQAFSQKPAGKKVVFD
ncbi:hypothetical protein OC842_001106 [Tilletia horrida]|uniref:Bud22 domain-containing protein n=1 Tax=Tilletia horrida TaxID=155126 RepID=A0AAN6GI88_9BASI|nr:hypothetical protein OC842_001106 [Tilletia horrida]KAK0563949.1 hypothetical protein OC844_001945 [Tilletia horrida]